MVGNGNNRSGNDGLLVIRVKRGEVRGFLV